MFFVSEHLEEMNMGYFEHMFISLHYAFILLLSCIKAFIHAFIPDIYVTSTSECIVEINKELTRHKKNNIENYQNYDKYQNFAS
jgi:hypothetical protein|uniref:Uncharacterized protein n=1 Tax=viral metagenome TaxID=1070528 RepID=A0A6C0DWS3_9ZZZZ